MSARIVSRIAFGIGMVAITVAPFVPLIYRWFYPPRSARQDPQGFWQTLGTVLDSLNSFTDGIAIPGRGDGGGAGIAGTMRRSAVIAPAAWRRVSPWSI